MKTSSRRNRLRLPLAAALTASVAAAVAWTAGPRGLPAVPSAAAPAAPSLAEQARRAGVDEGWLARAEGYIARSQYFIEPGAEGEQSPHRAWNRAHKLRFDVAADGLAIRGSNTKPGGSPWALSLRLTGVRRAGETLVPYAGAEVVAKEHTARAEDANVAICYDNSAAGMRQDFLLKTKPAGDGEVRVEIAVEGGVTVRAAGRDAAFADPSGAEVMRFGGLKATDANGTQLDAWMESSDGRLAMVVNDRDAVYPVLVDPMATTTDETLEPTDVTDGQFGFLVSSAGDVDADGLSDLLVFALGVDVGGTNGRGYLFRGSQARTPTTVAAFDTAASALWGPDEIRHVICAGDMDGDGRSDIAFSSSDAGRVWVYRTQGRTGTNLFNSIVTELAPDNDGSAGNGTNFGFSIDCAGDVNDDGAADLVVGAPAQERAYVVLGHKNGPPGKTADDDPERLTNKELQCPEENPSQREAQPDTDFGWCVAGVGSVDGDGCSDVAVGSPSWNFLNPNGGAPLVTALGRVYVFHGKSTGDPLPDLADSILNAPDYNANPGNGFFGQQNEQFGFEIAGAGDTNGDGYADMAVGIPNRTLNNLANVGIVNTYNGSTNGVALGSTFVAPATVIISPVISANARFGDALAGAMDVNGDGFADLAVGTPGAPATGGGATGRVDVYLGGAFLAPNDPGGVEAASSQDPIFPASSTSNGFGTAIANAGDVDGDGFSDLMVGEPTYDGEATNEGRVSIFHGSPNGISAAATTSSVSGSSGFATSVARAGDVNGDGFGDVIVGSPNSSSGEGRAYVFYGDERGLPAASGKTLNPGTVQSGDMPRFGTSVAGAGDVDRDGYEDVIVGAPDRDSGGLAGSGRAYIFPGGSSGVSGTAMWGANGGSVNARFGASVTGAACVDGDTFADVVVGAPGLAQAMVFRGGSGGPGTSASQTLSSTGLNTFGTVVVGLGDVNRDSFNDLAVACPVAGTVIVYIGQNSTTQPFTAAGTLTPPSGVTNSLFGSSIAAGDFNGDGWSDVVVGAPGFDDGTSTDEGRAYVYYGATTFDNTADVTLDSANQQGALFGSSVAVADVNADGFSDLVVGARMYDVETTNDNWGRAYVFQGSGTGLNSTVVEELNPVESDAANFGVSAACAGDVDGDGYQDVIIGATGVSSNAGATYTYYGNRGPGLPMRVRQYRIGTAAGLAGPYQRTEHATHAMYGIFARSFLGRTDVNAVFVTELVGGGNAVEPDVNPDPFLDSTKTGVNITCTTVGLTAATRYRWHARVRYSLAKGAVQPMGPRIYPGFNARTEADFRTN